MVLPRHDACVRRAHSGGAKFPKGSIQQTRGLSADVDQIATSAVLFRPYAPHNAATFFALIQIMEFLRSSVIFLWFYVSLLTACYVCSLFVFRICTFVFASMVKLH